MFLYKITHSYLKNDYQFFDTLKTKHHKIRGNFNLLNVKFHKLEWSSPLVPNVLYHHNYYYYLPIKGIIKTIISIITIISTFLIIIIIITFNLITVTHNKQITKQVYQKYKPITVTLFLTKFYNYLIKFS